ncbi:MAG: hypothetical protein ACLU37_05925 [Collinsella sp.]
MGEEIMSTAEAVAGRQTPPPSKSLPTPAPATACSAPRYGPGGRPAGGESRSGPHPGPLIHNPIVVRELAEAGVGLADTLDDAATGTVIIRAHGVVPQVIEAARERGLDGSMPPVPTSRRSTWPPSAWCARAIACSSWASRAIPRLRASWAMPAMTRRS